MRYTPDGQTLASGTLSGVMLWDIAAGKNLNWLSQTHTLHGLNFSADGKLLLVGGRYGVISVLEFPSGKETATFKVPETVNAVLSPDGKQIAVGAKGVVRLINIADRKERDLIKGSGNVEHRVAFSPDGKTLAVDRGDRIGVWDLQTGRERRSWASKQITISGFAFTPEGNLMAFTPDGNLLASAGGPDRTIKLLDVNTGTEARTLNGHQYMIWGIAISRDGKLLASGSVQSGSSLGEIKVWDISTGKEVASYLSPNEGIKVLEFGPDGQTLLAASGRGIRQWRIGSSNGQAP